MSPGLARIRPAAKDRKEEGFTTLVHPIDVLLLEQAYGWLKREAAPGVDGRRGAHSGEDLAGRLAERHDRVPRGSDRAQPSPRTSLPKPDGRQRPLGLAALEDKIVQRARVALLKAICEADFLGFSYGFRPGGGQHDARAALAVGIGNKAVNAIVDADIGSCVDSIDHEGMMRLVEPRIGDRRVLRLIRTGLKAGVVEDGGHQPVTQGTPQGALISPLLANLDLPYADDLRVPQERQRHARGALIVVRYADERIVGFEHRAEAERFWRELRHRLRNFALDLHPDTTRLVEFGRNAVRDRAERGAGQPQTFDFLGFTPVCTRSRRGGFLLARHTRRERSRAKLREIKQDLRRRWHQDVAEQGRWWAAVRRGHFA